MKELSSLSETIRTSQYRIADVAFFPVGDRQVMVCVRGTETVCFLPEVVAGLLKRCSKFKTIDEHVNSYCRKLQLNGTVLENIRYKLQHQLQDLAQEGYLVSSNQLLGNPETTSTAKEMQPYTSYLICATSRNGSTLLCEALKNTGLAGRPEEYFNHHPNEAFWKELWGASSYADYVASAIKEGMTSNGVFGAKIMWRQVDGFVDKLRTIPGYEKLPVPELLSTVFPNLHYIFMTRSDKVRQAVSYEKAIQTQTWAVMDETRVPLSSSQYKILGHHPLAWMYPSSFTGDPHFDFARIDALLRRIESEEAAWQNYFAENGITPFTVVYEDLVAAYEQTALQILDELAIPAPESLKVLPSRLKRQADAISEEWVQRYYEELSRK